MATQVVAEAALHHNVRRIVFASSAAVYGDPSVIPTPEDAVKSPLSPYGAAKLASEKLLLESAAKYGYIARCQRYFNVYGPRQDPHSPYSGVISIFLDHLRRNAAPTIFSDGEQTRDFISVHDVARANMIAATTKPLKSGIVNICTGREVSLNCLWDNISKNRPKELLPKYGPSRIGDINQSCGSPDAARSVLNFQAKHSVRNN